MVQKTETSWYDGGLIPMKYVFVPDREEWERISKDRELGVPYPEGKAAYCHTFDDEFMGCVCLMTFDPQKLISQDTVVIAGLVAHEATHCLQFVKRFMDEVDEGMGWETEAYAIQIIIVNILHDVLRYKEYLIGQEEKE